MRPPTPCLKLRYHRPEHVRAACERTLQDLGLELADLQVEICSGNSVSCPLGPLIHPRRGILGQMNACFLPRAERKATSRLRKVSGPLLDSLSDFLEVRPI